VSLTVVMCTGKFPPLESEGLVVFPQEILKGVLKATLQKGKLAVVYPAEEQEHLAVGEFGREGVTVYADHLSPYQGVEDLERLAERLNGQQPDLILLNCFGFGVEVKNVLTVKTGVPVIQSNALVALVLKELAS
ncbi:MAG: AroM family protein, partial [Candidatus Bathyarchaeota archaeon]